MSARKISWAGVIIALSIIFLMFASLLPKGKSIFYILSSLCILIVVWMYDIRTGILSYIATSLIGIFIIPNKMVVSFYILFFGIYPIVKALIERGIPIFYEILLKLLYYNFTLIILYFVFKIIIRQLPIFKFGFLLTIISSEFIFLLYDYLLTLLLQRLRSLKILEGR